MDSLYCHHCIRSFPDDARFCSQCGRRLHSLRVVEPEKQALWNEPADGQAAALEIMGTDANLLHIDERSVMAEGKPATQPSVWNWLMPMGLILLAAAATAAVYLYYQYETGRNEIVLRLQAEAKAAALGGEYDQALALLAEAAGIRPGFDALRADEEIIGHVIELERLAREAEERLASGAAREAGGSLDRLKSEMSGHKEPIYDKLRSKLDDLSMELTLLELDGEVETLQTVKELGELLNVVNGLIGEEAASLRERIMKSIRELTTAEADELVQRKNFTAALSAVARALAWAREDVELLGLQQRIRSEQARYEQAEQQRIEQAMQQAAEEDLINQTAAVEVVETERTVDEFGDLTIVGTLRNAATRPIYAVSVDYTLLGVSGNVIAKGHAEATPHYIEPGERMTYTATVYGVYSEETTVVIDHATWYLD